MDVFNGHEICRKYIPPYTKEARQSAGNRTRKTSVAYAPLFKEHADTEQLAYNLGVFRPGDEIEITLKMHGTSQRTGRVPVLKGYVKSFWDKVLRRPGNPAYYYDIVSGTRRVVLTDYGGGYYGSNAFRRQHHEFFEGKLWKGEEVYYEVVGYTDDGQPIMPSVDNKKIKDKDFVKQYGKTTTFSYGCDCAQQAWKEDRGQDSNKPISDIYVYRMTMTNEDGNIVEYTPDFMRYRCEQMGVKCVPVMWKGVIPYAPERIIGEDADGNSVLTEPCSAGEWVKDIAEWFYDGADPIGKTHIREGVVVRILNRPKFTAFKHKNFMFKVLSGIAVEQAEENITSDEDRLAEM